MQGPTYSFDTGRYAGRFETLKALAVSMTPTSLIRTAVAPSPASADL